MTRLVPVEADDAVDELRICRDRLGVAVDELTRLESPVRITVAFIEAMDAVSWAVEKTTAVLAGHRLGQNMDAVEERRIEAGLFPEADE